jgi:hypothetical protein
MKDRIMLSLIKAEFYDTGHEIEDLTMLAGSKILSVEGGDQERVILTVEHDSYPVPKKQKPKKK